MFKGVLANVADEKASKAKIKALSTSLKWRQVNPHAAFCSATELLGYEYVFPSPYCLITYKQGIEAEQTLNHFRDSSETLEGVLSSTASSNPKTRFTPDM